MDDEPEYNDEDGGHYDDWDGNIDYIAYDMHQCFR